MAGAVADRLDRDAELGEQRHVQVGQPRTRRIANVASTLQTTAHPAGQDQRKLTWIVLVAVPHPAAEQHQTVVK